MRRKAWYSVGFAAVSVIAYMFIGGVISLDFGDEDSSRRKTRTTTTTTKRSSATTMN